MNIEDYTYQHRDPDNFDVRGTLLNVVEATRHRKWLLVLTCALTLGLVTIYVYLWPPIYKAQAKIVAEGTSDFARDAFYVSWNVFRKEDPRTEIELMTTGPILKEVIEKEKLTYTDVYHPFLSHLAYLWQESAPGKAYRNLKKRFLGGEPETGVSPQEEDLARTMADMGEGISIEPIGESNVGRLVVKAPTRRAAQIANTLADVYLQHRTARYKAEAQKSYDVLSEEVTRAGQEVRENELRRLAFAKRNAVNLDFQKEILEMTKLTELEASIASGRTRIAANEAALRAVEQQLKSVQPTQTSATVNELNTVRETMKLKRIEYLTVLNQVREKYREDSPEVTEIKNNIAKLDELLAGEPEKVEKATTQTLNALQQQLISKQATLQADLQADRASLLVMEDTAGQLRTRLAAMPTLQTRMRDHDREVGAATEKYQALLGKRAQAAVSVTTAGAAMSSLRIVEYAAPPAHAWWPKTKYLYLGALAVGLILGVCAALLMSYADGRIRREHMYRGRRALPLYGSISIATRHLPLAVPPRVQPLAISSTKQD